MTIFICMPARDTCHADTAICLAALARATPRNVPLAFASFHGSSISQLRNLHTEHALAQGASGILWVDSDMRFPPDTATQLLAHNKPIVGATYRRRGKPYQPLGEFTGTEGLVPAKLLPGGMMLVRRAVYERLRRPWYSEHYAADGEFSTDDTYFCRAAIAAGIKIWCDLDLTKEVSHLGSVAVPWQLPE